MRTARSSAITSATGKLAERVYFDAFGQRRRDSWYGDPPVYHNTNYTACSDLAGFRVYQQISGVFNFGFAGALGLILMIVSLVIVILYHKVMSRVVGGVGV